MVDDGEPADLLLEKGPIIDPENFLQFVQLKCMQTELWVREVLH